MSIHRTVWEWLRTCPHVNKLSFNFGREGNASTILRPSTEVTEDFIDGSKRIAYECTLTVFLPLTFEANDSGNVDMLEAVDAIALWIDDQFDRECFPELDNGLIFAGGNVLMPQSEFAYAQDGMYSQYSVPFTINFIKE